MTADLVWPAELPTHITTSVHLGKIQSKIPKKLVESLTAIFSILNFIILEETNDYENHRTNHSVSQKQRQAFRNLDSFRIILA